MVLIIGCLRRIGRLIAWVLLRGCRLLWPPAWSQHDVEVCCSVMAIAMFFFVGGFLYMFSGDSKDVAELDFSEEHKAKLIKEYMKEKGWQLVREDNNIYDEANIVKVDGYIDEIEMDQIQKPRYKIINTKKEKEDRRKEKDRNRTKKDSQELLQLWRDNVRKQDGGDSNIGQGYEKFRESYKKASKLKNALQGIQPPLPPNVDLKQLRGKMVTIRNDMAADKSKMAAFVNNMAAKINKNSDHQGSVKQDINKMANQKFKVPNEDVNARKLVESDVKMSNYKKKPLLVPRKTKDGLPSSNNSTPLKGAIRISGKKRIQKISDKVIDGEGKKLVQLLNNPIQDKFSDRNVDLENLDLKHKNITVHNLKTAVEEDYECLNLKMKPPAKVCIYPVTLDVHVSYHIRNEGMWEPHTVKTMQKDLSKNPDIGLIDIGANIGVYSLVAATMGHNVVAVEPYEENIKHLQKAAHLNNITERITLLQNAVSDERRLIQLELPPDNQGGIAVNKGEDCTPGASCYETNTMFLDDIVHFASFTKAIMKIDIEGHEHRAFQKASVLFDKIYISSVYMEWQKLRSYYGSEITNTVDKDLTFDLVGFFVSRDYAAYSYITGARLKPGIWFSWPDDIVWRHKFSEVW